MGTLHLMIVDDDALMCNQLAALLDWREFGIELVAYASDGREAVEVLKKNQIDFVLTDMDMPGMNGVELIEFISEAYPHIHVIALSAYDDYHFVRSSMKYGAHDYILKSRMNREVMEHLVGEVVKKEQAREHLENHANLTYEQLLESFFGRLMKKTDFDRIQIGHIIKNLNINFNPNCLALILAEMDTEEDQVLARSLFHMCQQILKETDFFQAVAEHDGSGYCFVVSFRSEISQAAVLKKLEIWGRLMINNAKKFFDTSLSVSISDICRDIYSLKHFYRQAKAQTEVFFYDSTQSFVCGWTYSKKRGEEVSVPEFPNPLSLKSEIVKGNTEKLKQEWKTFFASVREKPGTISLIKEGCMDAVNRLVVFGEEEGIKKALLATDYEKIKTLDQWEECLISLIERLYGYLRPEPEWESYHKYTRAAMKKIYAGYGSPLSLTDIAEELGISAPYLSNTFKNDVRMGFNDYLNKLRIEKVIEEIEHSEGKLKDIAERSGFQNYNYFFKVFKEYTGKTPAQYFN